MTTKTQEIQQLLAAEKKAAETVSDARKSKFIKLMIFQVRLITKNYKLGKALRLKQAKNEAMKEIEVYKAERESTYKALEKSVS
jgi:V-type H+-transporting ATPase subunit G